MLASLDIPSHHHLEWKRTHVFDVKKHGGRPVRWGAERQGHQIVLLVHDSRLVDRDAILAWSCDSNNLPAEAEACAGEPR